MGYVTLRYVVLGGRGSVKRLVSHAGLFHLKFCHLVVFSRENSLHNDVVVLAEGRQVELVTGWVVTMFLETVQYSSVVLLLCPCLDSVKELSLCPLGDVHVVSKENGNN